MAGYLDSYGVTDQKRERRTKRILLVGALVAIVGIAGFFFFRNFREKRAVIGAFGRGVHKHARIIDKGIFHSIPREPVSAKNIH